MAVYDESQLPAGGEIWLVDNAHWYVVYRHNGIPMLWHIENSARLEAIFGAKPIAPQYRVSSAEVRRQGGIHTGVSSGIKPPSAAGEAYDPIALLLGGGDYERMVVVQPWLKDREILSVYVQAALEGRTPYDWEIQATNWWRSRTEAERKWVATVGADPETAQRMLQDTHIITRDAMMKAGIRAPHEALVTVFAAKLTTGQWTKEYWQAQMNLLADPYADPRGQAALDSDVVKLIHRIGNVDQTRKGEDEVKEMVHRWLGPKTASGWTEENIKHWAGQFRNDPDAKTNLGELLRRQFQVMFPVYADNPYADYESVAGAWRGFVNSIWGQDPDESDELFLRVVGMNDAQAAGELLRSEGLKRGIGKVVNEVTQGLGQQFNFGVRERAV